MKNHSLVLPFLFLFCVDVHASIVSDFSWIPAGASNTASTVLSDGTVVTLTTSPTPFDDSHPTWASFNNTILNPIGASEVNISLSFSRTITNLRLLVDDLDGFETLENFSITPTSVNGYLTLDSTSGVVNPINFDFQGNLIWDHLNSTSIEFTFNRPDGRGFLALVEFEISAVPVPAAIWLFITGAFGLVLYKPR